MLKLVNDKESINDLEEVMDLIYFEWGQYFRSSKETKLNKIKNSIENNLDYPQVYIMKENDNVIGTFTIKDKDLDNCDLSPWLACVIIKPEYRKQGYGRKLLNYIEEICNKHYPKIYLTTGLVGYYEKINFKYIESIVHHGCIDRLYLRESK